MEPIGFVEHAVTEPGDEGWGEVSSTIRLRADLLMTGYFDGMESKDGRA